MSDIKNSQNLHPDLSRILITESSIQARVINLASQISTDYAGTKELVLVGVLKGAFIFLADLARHLTIPHRVDFMAVSSYGNEAVSKTVRIIMDLREPIDGRDVLIVEDILDTGNTLKYLYQILEDRSPISLRTCVLTYKVRSGSLPNIPIDYLGFEIPNVWVVGYGLDYADKFRTLPFIAELKQVET
jgi:hypoxanthine phosphoribosyltransferase